MRKILILAMIFSLVLGVVGCENSKYVDNVQPDILRTTVKIIEGLERNVDNGKYITHEQLEAIESFLILCDEINLNKYEEDILIEMSELVMMVSEIKIASDKRQDYSNHMKDYEKQLKSLKRKLNIK